MSAHSQASEVGILPPHAENPAPVAFVALGGTISSTSAVGGGVVPTLTADALLQLLPGVADVARVEIVDSGAPPVPGPHLTLPAIVHVAKAIQAAFDEGAIGSVVTQGTDTIEETAFALDLLLPGDAPVVVTGAMRDPTLPGADGNANLLAAMRVAADPSARGLGAMVVFADEIHAARYLRKVHTTRADAFASPLTGPIGTVTEDRVDIRTRPERRSPRGLLPLLRRIPDVALIRAAIGDDGRLLDDVVARGYEGVVFEGFGGGHANPETARRLEQLATSVPVVLTSRVGSGALLRNTYGFVGSERDLMRRGLLIADDIDGCKARIQLSFLLGSSAEQERLRTWFVAET